ncbi:hypothetical protein POPTR_013G154650v4 [Populus trichocarpa]|uniref:Uncharacterized protein n=1 Tax=Populus trichocarpa TaxID=3694 RepID=A0ACC0S3W7_POPTR|nr:hypothetical protein POPTR_013G154650v4 [Populus trichocarpa]
MWSFHTYSLFFLCLCLCRFLPSIVKKYRFSPPKASIRYRLVEKTEIVRIESTCFSVFFILKLQKFILRLSKK